MELDHDVRGNQSDALRRSPDFVASNAPMPERLQRRVAPTGTAPPFALGASPLTTSALPVSAPASSFTLPSSELAIQLFAEAVSAGVHPAERVQRAAAHGLSGPSSSLPHLAAIQHSFGRHDISGVQAHVGGAAAEGASAMGAHGYAAGNSVAFAATPDLHLAAHEAAHVIQQRAGVHLKGGVGEVGDVYERHADAVADLVVQGKSAESLLDSMAPGGGSGAGIQRFAIQMNPHEAHGTGAGAAAAAPVTAPSDPASLLRYAHAVHGHLQEQPNQLVPYARALDRQLLGGGFESARDIQAVVSALQAIRDALARHPPGDLAAFRTGGSPTDGMIEDIAPFGNGDLWIAAQSAARDQERQHHAHHATGGGGGGGGVPRAPDPAPQQTDPAPVDPAYTDSAAGVEGRETGGELGRAATRPADSTDRDIASALDNASSAYDYASELGMAFTGFVGEVVMPIVQPMMMFASLVLTMDQALLETQNALRGFGIRSAVHQLSYFTQYPMTLSTSALMVPIKVTDGFRQERATAAGHFESEGDVVALIEQGVGRVATGVNQAVTRAESWPGVGQALQHHPEQAAQIHQDVRRAIYAAMVERMQTATSGLH